MTLKWASFEDRVRETAQYIWGRPCTPKRCGGVNLDGAVKLDAEIEIFIEMTENRTLGKVREDVVKLQTAKAAAFTEGVMARCFCVVNGAVTQAMTDAGAPHKIRVLPISDFGKLFFDFEEYNIARVKAPFGSSVNPLTGDIDETEYVAVNYRVDGRKEEASAVDIAAWLREGRNVILTGEYGTGKSRCIREVFKHLSEGAAENFCYPIAIDLRNSWGLSRNSELLRRHMSDLGLDSLETSIIRAFHAGSVAILFDGFDEIGSQAWSNDAQKLRAIRSKSLEGVKDTISKNKGGSLIAGREHYFSTADELFSILGLRKEETIVLRSKEEFSDTEILQYFQNRDIEVDIPEWLPRRPLICQTISDLAKNQFDVMFGDEGSEVAFWNHFIKVLCERDARIHVSFDADTIFSIFVQLARLTRSRPANVGPISLADLQQAFEACTGAAPVEEAAVMLQRLPSLGRVSAESNDRQFVDVYILDGLRAKDVISTCLGPSNDFLVAASSQWSNALDDLGQRVLAEDSSLTSSSRIDFAARCLTGGNRTMACDLIASSMRNSGQQIDFKGIKVENGDFKVLNFRECAISNLFLTHCYIGELVLPAKGALNSIIERCITPRVIGITSAAGLPYWINYLEAESFDSVASVSRIRQIGLPPSHEILTTIIRKTFFQKGSGRKEEALLRGLGSPATRNLTRRILNLLVRENLLINFRGDQGDVYTPVRSHTQRMQRMLDELRLSDDIVWQKVGEL